MNLARNLENSARFFPDHVAVIDGPTRLTYAQLDEEAGRLASALSGLGLGPGDRLALCAPNSATWLMVYFAALKLGAIAVTLSAQLRPLELDSLLGHARPRALFCDEARRREVAPQAGELGLKWLLSPDGPLDPQTMAQKESQSLPALEREREEPACVLYTGGTTGAPKGVLLSHENLITAAALVAAMERSTPADRALCFLPFNHVFGQMHIMNATVYSAGGLVLLPGFDLEAMLAAIAEHEVTKLYAVPTVYGRLLQAPDLKERLGQVRYCFSAAASMARELVRQWKERTGLNIFEAYGMTETASMVTYNHYHQHRVGSVGQAVGSNEVCIMDPQGQPLPMGQEGEICTRGRNVMLGYLDDPQASQEARWGSWLRTGDIGYLDRDGYLFIVDRLKDLIITGGENVYPREVEEVLFQRPEVAECSVVGLPDAEYGERVTAVLVPAPGQAIDPVALKDYLKQRLSGFKVPKQFVVTDNLPKSPAGKILKRQIKKELLEGDS